MQEIIKNKLQEIEKEQNIRIILAVESGSRAWGFASPDSDYDVRFIYYKPENEYLRLDEQRDVIELPINSLLDINGWDISKTLRLLYRSNPTLFEWLSSPIIYKSEPEIEKIKEIAFSFFSCKKGLCHYLSMAKSNYREYLKTDMVRAKKYFYVLRPIFACRWILEKETPPPMLFSELLKMETDGELIGHITRLLDIQMNTPIENSLKELQQIVDNLPPDSTPDWSVLNKLFLEIIQ